MVLYFSTTGNTKFVAEELGKHLEDTVLDLRERIQKNDYSPIHSDKPFVICSPVYVSSMPRFLTAFLKKTPLAGNEYIYFIYTSGGYAGISSSMSKRLARQKGLKYMGCAELNMIQNYIACDIFKVMNDEEKIKQIKKVKAQLPSIVESIKSLSKIKSRHVWLLELLITLPVNPIWCNTMQGTKDFYVTDKCIGCGKCANLCPLNAITLDDNKRPVWTVRQCSHCMNCIQNCPVEAIEYGNKTQNKKRYHIDKYRNLK